MNSNATRIISVHNNEISAGSWLYNTEIFNFLIDDSDTTKCLTSYKTDSSSTTAQLSAKVGYGKV